MISTVTIFCREAVGRSYVDRLHGHTVPTSY